ncbi:MAG: helix-turn-helix domain-containing protein [Actinomycetota bacterium]|nr:helix-turn-helix domain-containing protein [Actinomycetota bacterium]
MRRVSQEKLGELAGLHRTYVGHLERGEVNPSLFNIIRIAAALDIDPAELIQGLRPRPEEIPLKD